LNLNRRLNPPRRTNENREQLLWLFPVFSSGGGDVEWNQVQVILVDRRWMIQQQVLPDGVQSLTADELTTPHPRGGLSHIDRVFSGDVQVIGSRSP